MTVNFQDGRHGPSPFPKPEENTVTNISVVWLGKFCWTGIGSVLYINRTLSTLSSLKRVTIASRIRFWKETSGTNVMFPPWLVGVGGGGGGGGGGVGGGGDVYLGHYTTCSTKWLTSKPDRDEKDGVSVILICTPSYDFIGLSYELSRLLCCELYNSFLYKEVAFPKNPQSVFRDSLEKWPYLPCVLETNSHNPQCCLQRDRGELSQLMAGSAAWIWFLRLIDQ